MLRDVKPLLADACIILFEPTLLLIIIIPRAVAGANYTLVVCSRKKFATNYTQFQTSL